MKITRFFSEVLIVSCLIFLSPPFLIAGSYAPAAGEDGSTAVHMDDPAFVMWADGYGNYIPGNNLDAQWQTPENALGKAVGDAFDIVCLGSGGEITLTFERQIRNGPGWDFAVFENSFDDNFLELAYVEVSSDGTNFFRFPNDSRADAPVGGYGAVDPTDVDGLAGKYRQGYGAPFDLSDVEMSAVTHVRIVDIIGDGTFLDTDGDVIYDPYPTTGSAGFDLDAVGARYYGSSMPWIPLLLLDD